MRLPLRFLAALALGLSSAPAYAAPKANGPDSVPPIAVAQAKEILGRAVAFQTVRGRGQVPDFARYLSDVLTAGGFAPDDVEIERFGETASLVARYRGAGKKRPMLLAAHMDVVEADPKDWERDPFTMVEEDGFFFGRGVLDNKFEIATMVTTLVRLKKEGFKPSRDIILVLTGDEETTMATTQALAKRFPTAEFLLNSDAGGGTYADADGAPVNYAMQAAEKTYADFQIEVTNPGGHSSRPHKLNAIYELAGFLERLAAYQFPVQASELTRAAFRANAKRTPGALGEAMRRFAENPTDQNAIETLSADPEYIGQLRTTCVATMLGGGHALNALPQRAGAMVNCRIFPGVSVASVKAVLEGLVQSPRGSVTVLDNPVASDASPLRADVMAALRKAIDRRYPGLEITPSMSAGATDSLHFRNAGIPCYGVSAVFMRPKDDFTHGLNERVPVSNIAGSLDHWHVLLRELAR
jgi:carboxypeptidase PM20D1